MTTIAYRDGIMVADSATTCDGVQMGIAPKVAQTADDGLLGCCGNLSESTRFQRWLQDGANLEDLESIPNKSNSEGLWIQTTGEMFLVIADPPIAIEIKGREFFAIGSGSEIALGAMAAGASAEEAVRICCQYDCYSLEPLTVYKLKDL